MIVPALPLAQFRTHEPAIREAVARVLESGAYILGREVETFERDFAGYLGVSHTVGVASGTDALVLALRALDIGAGDEVITVSHTALATVAAILAAGATPVLVDIEPKTYTIDPAAIEGAVTRRTKAIIPVHLYGQAADMDAIMPIAHRRKLKVIEDCAQATGAMLHGKRLGAIGHAGAFSFYPTKNLGAVGDGGLVATNDRRLAERLRRLRQYGWNETRETKEAGVNSRLDELQAAILKAKLPALDGDNARRIELAARYDTGLAGLPVVTPARRPGAQHVYHLYVIALSQRDRLSRRLKEADILTGVHYPRAAHQHSGYRERVRVPKGGLPATQKVVRGILSLPIYPELSREDADRVIGAIRSHFSR